MAENSAIEWTDATWTPIRACNKATGKVGWHCEHASPGCLHCYSESFNEKRLGTGLPFKPGHRDDVEHFLDETMLTAPLRWRRPRRIFVCSMTDLFGDWVSDAWIDRVFAVMALAPQHTFQVLTKRSARMRAYLSSGRWADVTLGQFREIAETIGVPCRLEEAPGWPLPNVWLGVSAEDQRRADERVLDLLATPAAVRFVSAEPLLGPIDFTSMKPTGLVPDAADISTDPYDKHELDTLSGRVSPIFAPHHGGADVSRLDWIIVGGESGPAARPMHPAWARQIRDACEAAGTPLHFKQWGAWADVGPHPRGEFVSSDPQIDPIHCGEPVFMAPIGKKAAGRLLDGIEHNGMPALRVERRGYA